MPKFHGSIDELKELVANAGYDGEWHEKPNSCWRFSCRDKAGLNWSVNKGTVWFDGPNDKKIKLAAALEGILSDDAAISPSGDRIILLSMDMTLDLENS
jgi:hypothetical protein